MSSIKPYIGKEPYIFVSYAHKNSNHVLPIIARLIKDGYRVWYDEGIVPGSEWDDNIATHIENCSCMLAIMSEEYMASNNCKDELNYARDLDKPRLLIYLCEVNMPGGMKMRLNRLQAIFKYTYKDDNDFFSKVYEADMLSVCKNVTEKLSVPEAKPAEVSAPKPEEVKPAPKTPISQAPNTTVPTQEPVKPAPPKPSPQDESYMVRYLGKKVIGCEKRAKNVVVKDGTESIELGAFDSCTELVSVKLPDSLIEIKSSAFKGCEALKKINLPESLTTLGSLVFYSCKSLTEIAVPDSVKQLEPFTFAFCEELAEVKFGKYIKIIPKDALFACKKLKSLVIPSGVTDIGESAISNCPILEEITLPKTLKTIGKSAFRFSKIKVINFEGTKAQWKLLKKGRLWDEYTNDYIVHCADGDVKKK